MYVYSKNVLGHPYHLIAAVLLVRLQYLSVYLHGGQLYTNLNCGLYPLRTVVAVVIFQITLKLSVISLHLFLTKQWCVKISENIFLV